MAIITPTIDHIDDETLMLELRNLASAVDKNETALNNEMAQISERQDNIDETVAGFEDSITQNTQDIATIKQNITTIEQDITAVENKNAEQDTAIAQNETAIENEVTARKNADEAEATARQNADEAEATARANADITAVQLQIVSGAIQLMLDRELGALNADVDAPFIKTMELIPTATERAFKIRVTFWDNTQYDTNDFVIPAGGGTDVSVTGVTIQDGTTPNSFQVQIELSDGTPISSNDYPFPEAVVNPYPTTVTLGLSGTTLTVTIGLSNSTNVTGNVDLAPILANYVTDTELTQVQSDLQEQISGLKLSTDNNNMTLNGDSVQIVKSVSGIVNDGNLKITVNGVESSEIPISSEDSDITILMRGAYVCIINPSDNISPYSETVHIVNARNVINVNQFFNVSGNQTIAVVTHTVTVNGTVKRQIVADKEYNSVNAIDTDACYNYGLKENTGYIKITNVMFGDTAGSSLSPRVSKSGNPPISDIILDLANDKVYVKENMEIYEAGNVYIYITYNSKATYSDTKPSW